MVEGICAPVVEGICATVVEGRALPEDEDGPDGVPAWSMDGAAPCLADGEPAWAADGAVPWLTDGAPPWVAAGAAAVDGAAAGEGTTAGEGGIHGRLAMATVGRRKPVAPAAPVLCCIDAVLRARNGKRTRA
jgi:hypothetical protein